MQIHIFQAKITSIPLRSATINKAMAHVFDTESF